SKDLALHIIATIGAAGATGYAVEFAGPAVTALSIEAGCTLCNLSIEARARAGLVGPDETTFSYLHGKLFAPRGTVWDDALAYWNTLPTDDAAHFDNEVHIDA